VIDVATVRATYPIAAVVEREGVALRPSGRRLVGSCPLHDDRHPSFTVYPDTGSFYCFGCGAGGDVIAFLARLREVGFREAVALLGGTALPVSRTTPWRMAGSAVGERVPRRATDAPPDAATRSVIAAAADYYHTRLLRSGTAQAYLAGRGVTSAISRRHRLGFADGRGLDRHLARLGCDLDAAEQVGLLHAGYESFAGRVIIPDLDAAGRATWLTGRAVTATGPRYLSLRLPAPILGLRSEQEDEVLLTEGPFDLLTARAWGLPAVALLGTRVSPGVVAALRRFRRVYTALDADPAGTRATRALAEALGARVVPVLMPDGAGDVNDLAQLPDGRRRFLAALRATGYDTAPDTRAA
jgi:DNA primase